MRSLESRQTAYWATTRAAPHRRSGDQWSSESKWKACVATFTVWGLPLSTYVRARRTGLVSGSWVLAAWEAQRASGNSRGSGGRVQRLRGSGRQSRRSTGRVLAQRFWAAGRSCTRLRHRRHDFPRFRTGPLPSSCRGSHASVARYKWTCTTIPRRVARATDLWPQNHQQEVRAGRCMGVTGSAGCASGRGRVGARRGTGADDGKQMGA